MTREFRQARYISFILVAITILCSAQSLRQAASDSGVLLGAAVRPYQFSETAYSSTLAREFNMVEPEDAMKWPALRPAEDIFDFHLGDAVVQFASAHLMKVRGHCLVWDHDNPDWLIHGRFTPSELSQLLHEHITRVMQHFAGQVFAWDVINEAIDERNNVRDSIWYNKPGIGLSERGTAYIEQVFRWAHDADPHALLFYNEAEGEVSNSKSNAIFAMLKDFKARGVPIDGVGLQMHIPSLDGDVGEISQSLAANMHRIAALGLQVQITELDVSIPVDRNGVASPTDLARQAEFYRAIARACLENARCTAIQTWGFTDKYSWIGSHSQHKRGQALLFDKDYLPKPSYRAVMDELLKGRNSPN